MVIAETLSWVETVLLPRPTAGAKAHSCQGTIIDYGAFLPMTTKILAYFFTKRWWVGRLVGW